MPKHGNLPGAMAHIETLRRLTEQERPIKPLYGHGGCVSTREDRSLLRLIGKWLSVGVVEEDGRRIRTKQGTPQGGVISPHLANIFLHHVVDVFVHEWRKTQAKGEIYIVRYADDFVIGCEHKEDAGALLEAIDERLREYGLTLNRDKTRLIRFGRYWQDNEKGGGSDTFDFLGGSYD